MCSYYLAAATEATKRKFQGPKKAMKATWADNQLQSCTLDNLNAGTNPRFNWTLSSSFDNSDNTLGREAFRIIAHRQVPIYVLKFHHH